MLTTELRTSTPPPLPPHFNDTDSSEELSPIYWGIRASKSLEEGLEQASKLLLALLNADLFTIYRSDPNGKELKSFFRSGPILELNNLQLAVPYSPATPAGYVALNHRSLLISDITNKEELANIHPQLGSRVGEQKVHGRKIRSLMVVPIKDSVFQGVLEVATLEGSRPFSNEIFSKAKVFSHILAQLLKSDFQQKPASGPYDKLIEMGRLTSEQLGEIKRTAFDDNTKITNILKEDYEIPEDLIGLSLENYYRVPYMKYDASLTPPAFFIDKIEKKYLKSNLWLPVEGDQDKVVVLINDPSDQQRIFEIDKILNARSYVFKVGLADHILKYLNEDDDEMNGQSFANVLKILEEKEKHRVLAISSTTVEDERKLVSSSAIIQLVKRIIIDAVGMGSSDIHIEPGKNNSPGIVRVRVDGDCRKLQDIPKPHMAALIARIKVVSGMDISERRLPQDGKCIETIRGRKIELRVTTYPTDGGESAVLRILSQEKVTPLEQLNLSKANLTRIKELTSKLHGMFLVVGPTGVGKTVTMHGILQHLNKEDVKIWTAEDPIEITQPGLQQMQMKPKIGLTFASAMRSFLRGDPDVILVGEMRDKETAGIAIEGSLTGHLVLSTLHSNSATETITRLLNLGMDPVNFCDALVGIMSQRLVKTLCNHCKEEYQPDAREFDFLVDNYGRELFHELGCNHANLSLYRPTGCSHCEGSGYAGRTAVHELLTATIGIQKLIFSQASQSELKEQAIKDGMRTLKQDGIQKILLGLIDYKQLNRIVSD